MIELNRIIHADCMDIMAEIPDKYFELAITDPPYSELCNLKGGSSRKGTCGWKTFSDKIDSWNIKPDNKYFKELFRISQNQIVWGGNYFTDCLPCSQGWIFWDKGQRNFSLADGELAFSSFNKALRVFTMSRAESNFTENKTHPNQKPINLYRWLLQNYAKPGDKIIDTHSGSGSLACACHLEKFDFLAIEKDEDYFKSSVERLETLRSQGRLF